MPLPLLPRLIAPLFPSLRLLSHAIFFLETQRLLLRLVRPVPRAHLQNLQSRILSRISSTPTHHYVPDHNGNAIHVVEYNPTGTRVCVLLHGHSMSSAFWYRNIDDLVRQRYRVLAVDLLGWGHSDRPTFNGKTPQQSLDWFLDSLLSVFVQLQLSNVVLIAHSLGAYLSLTLAQQLADHPRHAALISRLVLVSPPCALSPIPLSRALYFSLPPQRIIRRCGLLAYLLFHLKYPNSGPYVENNLREYTFYLAMQPVPSGEVAVKPIIRLALRPQCTRPLVNHLNRPCVPVDLVCGDRDSSMPVEGVYALHQHMIAAGWRCQLHVVRGADHCPMLERPDEFANILADAEKRWSFVEHPSTIDRNKLCLPDSSVSV